MQSIKTKIIFDQQSEIKQNIERALNIMQDDMNKINQFRSINPSPSQYEYEYRRTQYFRCKQNLLQCFQYRLIQASFKKLQDFKHILTQNQKFIEKITPQIQSCQQEIKSCLDLIKKCNEFIRQYDYSSRQICEKHLSQLEKSLNTYRQMLSFIIILRKNKFSFVQSVTQLKRNEDIDQKIIQNQKIQIDKLNHQMFIGQSKLKQLQAELKQCKKQLKSRQQIIYPQKKQLFKIIEKSSPNVQELTKMKQQLKQKSRQIKQKDERIKTLENYLSTTKFQNSNQMTQFIHQIAALESSLTQNESYSKKLNQQYSEVKNILNRISEALQRKLNKKQLKINEIVNEIEKYRTPVGMKLITSTMIHGNDNQRSQIVDSIEKFSNKTIKRTDLLCRYPETKSMFLQLPKEGNNFAFTVLYKTKNQTVFGSYSNGMKKTTFIFSFIPQQEGKQSDVKFYIPEKPSENISSIDIFQGKYLQYGSGQLKVNTIDLSTIIANSNIDGEKYYNLNWKEVMNESVQQNVPLIGVELHRVEFQ